jgi:hypothetical protein
MTLIHTCQLCGANSFDYLTQLQRHASKLAAKPGGVDALELPTNAGAGQSMMDPTWLERIDCGHAWVRFRNGRQTSLSEGEIR